MGNFLEYSNFNHVNIIPQNEFEELIQEVFGVISTNLCKSLGPLGSSATILDGALTEATKDGYSILKKYCFHNRYKKMIYNLIMKPCTKMNNTVGDGTTTAIALTSDLFMYYKHNKEYLESLYRLPRQFNTAWDEVISTLADSIKEYATPINPNDWQTIYNIAYVTSNGDAEISRSIADVYSNSKSPSIKQKDSPTNKSYIEPINGYDFPADLISDAFVRNQDLSCTENNVYVMIFDHKLETDYFKEVIIPINEVIRAMGKKLIILAPYYDVYMCETVVDQYITGEFRKYGHINLILAQYELGKLEDNQLVDLATVLRTKVITQELATALHDSIGNNPDVLVSDILNKYTCPLYRLIGKAAVAMLSCTTGSIFKVEDIENDEKYMDVLNHAKNELETIMGSVDNERQAYSSKIYKAKARIAQLEMQNYIYYIGADSALQKQIIWDSVEDVIKCVRSAIKYGMVPGCQLSIIKACDAYIEQILGDHKEGDTIDASIELRRSIAIIIKDSVWSVYNRVLHGPEGLGMIKMLPKWQYTEHTPEAVEELVKEANEMSYNIIKRSCDEFTTYNMETCEFDSLIVTSAETDMMVLTAASELVKILISGNQCIFLDSEVNDTHNETVAMYV